MFYIADQQIRELLDHRAAVDIVDQALADQAFGSAVIHVPQLSQAHALTLSSRGAVWTTRRVAALRADAGSDCTQGLVLVFDLGSSAARAVIDAAELDRRAAAAQASAVARRLLATPPRRLLLYGTDDRTQALAECLCEVMRFEGIDVGSLPGQAPPDPRWCMRLQTAAGTPVRAVDVHPDSQAWREAELLVVSPASLCAAAEALPLAAALRLCLLPGGPMVLPEAGWQRPLRLVMNDEHGSAPQRCELHAHSLMSLYQGHAPWHTSALNLWIPGDGAMAQTALAYLALQRLTTPIQARAAV